MKKIITIAAIALIATAAQATIINIPADYGTITEGIAASVSGDTVLVAPGAYWEDFSFGGRNILLTSSHGPDTTEIHGRIVFGDYEDSTCILQGFSIIGTNISTSVSCRSGTKPIVIGNIIKYNSCYGGSGIGIGNSGAKISNNIISGNSNMNGGG